MKTSKQEAIRNAVRGLYDLQQLKNQSGSRTRKPPEVANEIALDETSQTFMGSQAQLLATLEKNALKEVDRLIDDIPISKWLRKQRGVGPTMTGVILSEIDISRADTPSALWRFAGLGVVDGRRERRQKGVKSPYNGFLKTKMVGVLADLFIKMRSPWRDFYDNDKHRKEHQLVPECMACEGTGTAKFTEKPSAAILEKPLLEMAERDSKRAGNTETPESDERVDDNVHRRRSIPALRAEEKRAELHETTGIEKRADAVKTPAGEKRAKKKKGCHNCGGTGGPAPWGRSQAHRSQAAKGYMMKMFLLALWREWRTLEGLSVPPDYAEAVLGRVHGDHGGAGTKQADDSETPVEKERAAS